MKDDMRLNQSLLGRHNMLQARVQNMELHVDLSVDQITSHLLHVNNSNDTSTSSSEEDEKATHDDSRALGEELIQLCRTTSTTTALHAGNWAVTQSTESQLQDPFSGSEFLTRVLEESGTLGMDEGPLIVYLPYFSTRMPGNTSVPLQVTAPMVD